MPFTVVNNENETATLAITGGAPGAAVTFWRTPIAIQDAGGAWTATGSATLDGFGEGSDTVAVPKGLYLFQAVRLGLPYLGSYRENITDGSGSTATQTRRAIADRILSLALGLTVEEQWAHDETNLSFPCVILSPGEGMAETDEQGNNLTDDVGYPVMVEIFDRQDVYDHSSLPDYEDWRHRIIKAFRNQPLDEVQENLICRIEYGSVVEPNLPAFQFLMSRFLIRAVAREFRQP